MPQSLRPTRIKLRKVQGQRSGQGQDIGNLHVLDYWLYHATRDHKFFNAHIEFRESRIGRYLDGEEERDGRYR